jgi:hypothetical protein
MSLMQRPDENPTTSDPSGTDSPKRIGIRERLTDAARACGRPDLADVIAAASTPPWCSALFPEFGTLFELLNRGGYDHFISAYEVAGRRLFSIAATQEGHVNQFVVLTEHDLTNPIILGAVLLAAGTDEFDGALSREDALGVLAELGDGSIPAPQRGLVETIVLPEPEVPFPALVDPPAWRAAVMEWAQDPENSSLTSVFEVQREREAAIGRHGFMIGLPGKRGAADRVLDLLAADPTTEVHVIGTKRPDMWTEFEGDPKPMGLDQRLTELLRAVGRPELADTLPDAGPVKFHALDPSNYGLARLFLMLGRYVYSHTFGVWVFGDHELFSIVAHRPDSPHQYVILTEHDLLHPDIVGLVLLATGPDENQAVISREEALDMLARLEPGLSAPQLGVIDVVPSEEPEPGTPLGPPKWRAVAKDWNTLFAVRVEDHAAVLERVADVIRQRRTEVGVTQDGTPATFVFIDEAGSLLAPRQRRVSGATSRPGLLDAVLLGATPHAEVTTYPAVIRSLTDDDVDAPWPAAEFPGGDVETEYGTIPGCVRSTCVHSRMAHDVEDDQDPVPLCGAPDCPCGKLTPAIIREFPEYYIAGPGRERASETNCRHDYRLTDSCPGCDLDQELEETIERHSYQPADWIPEFAARIHGARKRAGNEDPVTVGDVITYTPPAYQASAEDYYMNMWWDLPKSRRGDLPQPPEHVCVPQAACGCCPGCGDGCGDCEGCIPCVPGFTTCVMPRGHQGDCVPPMTTIYAAHRRTLAVGVDGALL